MTKTKIDQKFTHRYGPTVLWWDDVCDIFEILQTHASAVELETSKYKFTTLDVAKEHMGKASQYDVKFSASSPYISIDGTSVYIGSGSTAAQIFIEIDRIFRSRERKPKIFYSGAIIVPTLLIGGITLLPIPIEWRLAALVIQIFGLLWAIYIYFLDKNRRLVIHTLPRAEAPGFFQRNKDQLLMYIITFILGGALALGGSYLKDHYFSSMPTSQH